MAAATRQFDLTPHAPVSVPPPMGFGSRPAESSAAAKDNSSSAAAVPAAAATGVPSKALKERKAMELARSGLQSGFMMVFMLWMTGGSVHIFSIMMTVMSLLTPLRAILGVSGTFERFADIDSAVLLRAKIIFVAIHLAFLAFAVYKGSNLGLLPTATSDWVGYFFPVQEAPEIVGGGFITTA